jgi:hypothetical protein
VIDYRKEPIQTVRRNHCSGCKKNKKDSVRIILKKMRMDDRILYPSPTGIKTVLESLTKENAKAKGADPSPFVDASILKSLEDSGFIKGLYD